MLVGPYVTSLRKNFLPNKLLTCKYKWTGFWSHSKKIPGAGAAWEKKLKGGGGGTKLKGGEVHNWKKGDGTKLKGGGCVGSKMGISPV